MTVDTSKYKKLTDRQHVRTRPGMYIGSITPITSKVFIPNSNVMVEEEITFSPALMKMFDEIISNSVDEHIKSGSVTRINVSFDRLSGTIIVEDDGGIPVIKHPEYGVFIPTMIFGELRTGSNFEDDSRMGAGMNGLGAKLTSIFSEEFFLETCDGKNKFSQRFSNGLEVIHDPVIKPSTKKGTKIEFSPDYTVLKCTLDEDNIKRLTKRVYDVAGCNPKINVYLDGNLIKVNKFIDYVGMYIDKERVVEFECPNWHIAVAPNSDDTFKHISFVNGVDTFNGGTHVEYISNQICHRLREYLNKKHKVDVKPNNIKQQLTLFINCKVNAPTFTSQTKEFMSLDVKDYGTSCEFTDAFVNKLIKSEVLQNIIDWIESEKRRAELANLRKLNKDIHKNNYLKKIVKFEDATAKDRSKCMLFLAEGDSAANPILSCRDETMGVFPLRGKPLNVRDIPVAKLILNEEFSNIMAILGLKLGHDDMNISDLRFGGVVVAADFDNDGQHIFGLLINMFHAFWPNLLKQGLLYRLKTPMIVAKQGKKTFEFFDRVSYNTWKLKNPDHKFKYFKGLGTFKTEDFKKFIEDPNYRVAVTCLDEDFESINLAFDKRRADDRKTWLAV